MAIDAKIIDVVYNNNGCFLILSDRPPRRPGDHAGCCGQKSLRVVNPCPKVNELLYCEIWGSRDVYYNDFKIGHRISATKIQLYYSNFKINTFVNLWKELFS